MYPAARHRACAACLIAGGAPATPLGGVLELEEELAVPGPGTLYRARHDRLGEVAVRFLPEPLVDDRVYRRRFAREAKRLARLSHPGIVKIHEFFCDREQAYVVTEPIAGSQVADRVPMSTGSGLEIAIAVAAALAYAHGKGVVHGDLGPASLIADPTGRVKVVDLGISRLVHPLSAGWTSGGGARAFACMAPEARSGGIPTPAMDVYSLGALLLEMVGRPALAVLLEATARAMEVDPRRRPGAAELARDLERVLGGPV